MPKINASIKYGKGYDEPWLTFEGDDASTVRGLIVDAFNLEVDDDVSLSTVVTIATRAAQGVENVSRDLKASVIGEVKTNDSTDSSTYVSDGGEHAGDSGDSSAATNDPDDALVPLFANASSLDELRTLWAKHKDAYNRSKAVQQAYKDRGQALKSN